MKKAQTAKWIKRRYSIMRFCGKIYIIKNMHQCSACRKKINPYLYLPTKCPYCDFNMENGEVE